VNERSIVVLGALIGAAAGLAASYLFLTEEGRRLRQEIEPEVDTLVREIGRLKGAFDEVRQTSAAGSSWPRRSA
jgi:hypothetical protein